jgi:hypothetical protein
MEAVMRRTTLSAVLLLAVQGAVGAPAWAQTPATADLFDAASNACQTANQDKTTLPQDDLAICGPALARIDEIYAAIAAPTQHETNLHHMYRAFAQTMIGGSYAEIDKVRSARVCTQAEASWAELAKIVDAQSPPDYAQAYVAMRTAAVGSITKCRAEMGTPPGAPPLPSG